MIFLAYRGPSKVGRIDFPRTASPHSIRMSKNSGASNSEPSDCRQGVATMECSPLVRVVSFLAQLQGAVDGIVRRKRLLQNANR